MEKYLINIKTGNLFIRTPELAGEDNMAACDKNGKLLNMQPDPEPGLIPPGIPDSSGVAEATGIAGALALEPTLDDFKETLDGMDLDQLKAKAEELEISYSPRIGEDTLRARIIEEVEERLGGGE